MGMSKNTRVMFIKYHETDQQPLSKKAAEKLGVSPAWPSADWAWCVNTGMPWISSTCMENLFNDVTVNSDYDPHIVALTSKMGYRCH